MSARKWGVLRDRILAMLEDLGPMTSAALARELGEPFSKVSGVVSRLTKPSADYQRPRRVHVHSWVYDGEDGGKAYPRALYAIGGDQPDAPKPARKSRKECNAAYHARRFVDPVRLSSVFNLGRSVRAINAQRRRDAQEGSAHADQA